MSNTFDKLSVLESFIEEVNSYLPEIGANLERLALTPGDMDALEETYRRTHTIRGSASMMNFPGLAHVAHGMEDILGDALDGLASLDEPTLGLLQRSLERMYRLLNGIRGGINEDAVIAEDDADYTQYRSLIEVSAQANESEISSQAQLASQPSLPSLDEVLASFRTPSVSVGEEISWPEDPATVASSSGPVPSFTQAPAKNERPAETLQKSALEMLVASTRQPTLNPPSLPPVTPRLPVPVEQRIEPANSSALQMLAGNRVPQPPAVRPQGSSPNLDTIPNAYNEVQGEINSLESQTKSLRELVTQLRGSMSVIETQRAEFKGFLDGSKDALDRMEEWAGQAMGLNLRNSPDQVRRYLPLSVMWVANSKLKKTLEILSQIALGTEVTQEQMLLTIQQLYTSAEAWGQAFQQLRASRITSANAGWTPWEVQVMREADNMRERVTFERQGDPIALRSEIEARVREEVRQEFQARAMTLAARTELEQQIREEVRREFETKRDMQERSSSALREETLREMEFRLRSDLEIQIRQEFLSQINQYTGNNATGGAQTLMPPSASVPRTSNFVDQAQLATGLSNSDLSPSLSTSPLVEPRSFPSVSSSAGLTQSQQVPPVLTPAHIPNAPQPVRQVRQSSVSGNEFSDDAAEVFRLEAEEHLQTISVHVAALEKSPTNRDLIQGVRRATHTLKGAAGMMGFRAIADLCHISEDLLDSIMEGTITISPVVLSLILDTAEILDAQINGGPGAEEPKLQALRTRYSELLGEQSAALPGSTEEELEVDIEDVEDEDNSSVAGVITEMQEQSPSGPNTQSASSADLSVRVRLQKLDELVNLFGELLVNRSVLEDRVQRLTRLVADVGISSTRLREVGQKLESNFEAATLPSGKSVQVMPGEGDQSANSNGKVRVEPSHVAEFDELELDRYTEFHRLARGLSESVSDMGTLSAEMDAVIRDCESVFARENRLSTTFQDRLMKARLVPLSSMTPRLYRAARAVALKQHKDFEFLLEGEETEVDRTVYEEIAGPLLHLMRNAVNHALETPEVRQQKGKRPVGEIKLSAAYEGNQVVITVRDDGAGIDTERVRSTALARGLIRPDQVLSDNDIIELIFYPGFSTAEVLSEESGRGVGLDVVRDSVSRLRGTLVVESTPGQGTAFTMKFPTSLAIQSAMMVRVGPHQYAIPTVMVEAIGRLDNFKRTIHRGRPAIVVQNQQYPLSLMANYLALPHDNVDERAPLLLVNAGGNRMALIVDEIKGKLDVVMKNLGPHLRNVHGIAGGTVLGNGRVVLILELSELLDVRAKVMGTVPTTSNIRSEITMPEARPVLPVPVAQATPPPAASALRPEHGKHILVVDDSPSVRRVVGNMLKQHGWEVQVARDGLEALEMITHETPAAVLLDIEMPRMDGYELMATVRAQAQYRTLPMVVLTSRAASKHQQRAMQLGASDYVVKPYQDEELLSKLNLLVYGTTKR